MSTPSSSSSIPYRYAAVQSQDPRVPVPQPYQLHRQPSASTSTASAYAHALQQQQLATSRPGSYSSASASTNTSPYVPSPIRPQPHSSQPRRPSPLADRPHSIDELARIAKQNPYDRYGDIKQDLRYAEVYISEGKKDLEAGDLEWAFVHFARTATLVLERMPTNPHYREMKEAHRVTLSDNGNFCLEKMSEIKPKLVDRYEVWRQRNPNTKAELDMVRMLSAMAVRDNEELAIRAQASREKRAASKDDAARRAYAEEERRRHEEALRRDPQRSNHDEEFLIRQDAARQAQAREAERRGYEEARRRHEEARRRDAEERAREEGMRREAEERARSRVDEGAMRMADEDVARHNEMERRRREAVEEGRRKEEEIARRKYEEAKRQEHAQRQEQEAASRRKSEELEHRRRLEETRRREQEGIAQRQREAEAQAQASRSMLRVSMPVSATSVPPSSSSSSSASSESSSTTQALTPRQQDELPILPLESPTRDDSDPRKGRHHPQPQHAIPVRATGRSNTYHDPITTTSPPPLNGPVITPFMTEHQRAQGYTPSLQSMFSTPITGPPTGLLFSPNHPEGPSSKNMPSSPDRPPAHIRHMWEQAGYGYQYSQPGPHSKSKPAPPGDSRILRPEQVRDEAVMHSGKELRIVKVPQSILPRFLNVAALNTARNRETCALLMGRESGKEFKVSTLLIPKQHSTSDTCTMDEEELVSEFTEKRNMVTLGWIHTHPTQSCFMSSLDLHTHAGFQCMLPEFFAIVCAPKQTPNCGIFRLTDPPGLKIILQCPDKNAFHPHGENPIYTDADKGHVVWDDNAALEIVDLRDIR